MKNDSERDEEACFNLVLGCIPEPERTASVAEAIRRAYRHGARTGIAALIGVTEPTDSFATIARKAEKLRRRFL